MIPLSYFISSNICGFDGSTGLDGMTILDLLMRDGSREFDFVLHECLI